VVFQFDTFAISLSFPGLADGAQRSYGAVVVQLMMDAVSMDLWYEMVRMQRRKSNDMIPSQHPHWTVAMNLQIHPWT